MAQKAAEVDVGFLGVARQILGILDLKLDREARAVTDPAEGGDDGGQIDLAAADADGGGADMVLEMDVVDAPGEVVDEGGLVDAGRVEVARVDAEAEAGVVETVEELLEIGGRLKDVAVMRLQAELDRRGGRDLGEDLLDAVADAVEGAGLGALGGAGAGYVTRAQGFGDPGATPSRRMRA